MACIEQVLCPAQTVGESIALLRALESLSVGATSTHPAVVWPWGTSNWQCSVLVAPVVSRLALEMNAFDFLCGVLQPLDEYLRLRVLEYDDF